VALPRPPINTMTDFVVFAFVSIVVMVLFVSVVGVLVLAIVQPETDRSTLVNSLVDIVSTLIGALVGFIAGKGQGRSEVHDEQAAEEHRAQAAAKPTKAAAE
jgi:uncharacterized membrane protein